MEVGIPAFAFDLPMPTPAHSIQPGDGRLAVGLALKSMAKLLLVSEHTPSQCRRTSSPQVLALCVTSTRLVTQ